MEATPQTIQQLERAIRKVADNFPAGQDAIMTDIHLQVKPSSGELLAFDDNDEELTRIVVEQWINSGDELYDEAATLICRCLEEMRESIIDHMAILHPFSFVLMDEDGETLRDLYLVDDDTIILNSTLMEGLDEELDQFLKDLLA
ncbi:MAG: hypothetical protein J5671_05870 [Bacteroidaceae bacterium]|nr:hypothetical protein [Bacteroidaceae bacterium]